VERPRFPAYYADRVDYQLDRRAFLATALAAPLLKAAVKFPVDARHRLAVATYPFRDVIGSRRKPAGMNLQQFAASLVEKFDVCGIEPWSPHFESIEPAYVLELADAFKRAGLQVVNIPCDVGVKLCGTDEERKAALVAYRQWVDAAVVLGSPSIRVHCPKGENPADISCAVQGLKALAEYGAARKIVINLENDNPKSEDPQRIVKVIESAGTPYLRALPDFCNSMLIHDDQDYNAGSLAMLFRHAYNISHVKDVEFSNGKAYRVDVDRLFAIAKKARYRGYFSMESESDQDPYESTKRLIAATERNL
jgi:sugar phosphate isomerase/epimerase